MVALAPCPSCQFGDHEGHIASWKPAPPNVMGGFYCQCKGDCTNEIEPLVRQLFKAFTEPVDPDEPNRSCIRGPNE